MSIQFKSIQDGAHFSATADGGAPFPVGARVKYNANHGLSNDTGYFGSDAAKLQLYNAADYEAVHPFWASFIEPTAICEGQSFISLNTYDRAHFTFGFAQFAAHVPDGDFILWFRDVLERPEAADYFPDLKVQGGRIVKVAGGTTTAMETQATTQPLQLYLNPNLVDVDDAEVIAAARLIHWHTNLPAVRQLQVDHMVATALGLVKRVDNNAGLDGRTADLCCIAMDVLHQGRGSMGELKAALGSPTPFDSLLKVGAAGQPDRVTNLTKALQTRRAKLQTKKWSRAAGNFV